MADFSFLNDEPEDQSIRLDKVDAFNKVNKSLGRPEFATRTPGYQEDNGFYRAGEGKTKDVGPKFSGLDPDVGESEEAGQGPGAPQAAPAADAVGDFQKKRAKAADFAKNEAFKGIDRLHAVVNTNRPGGPAFDPEQMKSEMLGLDPSKYAEHLYQAVQANNAPQSGTGQPLINEDAIMGPVEAAVTNYKRLQLEGAPQAQAVQSDLNAKDLPGLQQNIQRLSGEIENAKQEMAVAATSRQKQQIKDKIDFFSSQQRQLQRQLPPEQETQANGEPLDKDVNIDAIATAAGVPRQEILQANTEMRRMVMAHGVAISAPVTPMTFPLILTNLVSTMFNPQKASQLLSEMLPEEKEQPQQEPGMPQEGGARPPQKGNGAYGGQGLEQDPRFQNVSNQIAQREGRRDQIWNELRNSHTFNNVGDVLGFIVCSVLIGAQNAAHIFTNMDKVGNLRWELDKLDHETTQLYHQQDSYIQLSQHARAQAAQEQHGLAVAGERERHDRAMETYYKMKTGDKSAFSPEDKKVDLALQHSYRYQSGNLDAQKAKVAAMEKILDRGPIDPDFKGAQTAVHTERAKLMKMQTDFAGWKQKVSEWYRQHGVGDIEPINPPKGDTLTMPQ